LARQGPCLPPVQPALVPSTHRHAHGSLWAALADRFAECVASQCTETSAPDESPAGPKAKKSKRKEEESDDESEDPQSSEGSEGSSSDNSFEMDEEDGQGQPRQGTGVVGWGLNEQLGGCPAVYHI
jgi:hypothetical protein